MIACRSRSPAWLAPLNTGSLAAPASADATNWPARLDPVTPADNPKSGNAFSTRTCPRRCNLDLDANRILTWAAIASRSASRHACPGPLRGARGTCRRRGSHLREGASVRRNDNNGQGDKFHERFHGSSPISPWLPTRHETKLRRPGLRPCLIEIDDGLSGSLPGAYGGPSGNSGAKTVKRLCNSGTWTYRLGVSRGPLALRHVILQGALPALTFAHCLTQRFRGAFREFFPVLD